MIDLVSDNRDAIVELCRRYGVESLDVFGSAATGAFHWQLGDDVAIDFIVKFVDMSPGVAATRYLEFAEALEQLLGRPVDLKFDYRIANPYLQCSINASRKNIFERSTRQAAV